MPYSLTKSDTTMKQLVVNKYKEVFMVMGNTPQGQTTIGTYPNVQAALDGMSRLYQNTIYEAATSAVKIYGVVEESNGFKHVTLSPIYTTITRQFWGGRQPQITELTK